MSPIPYSNKSSVGSAAIDYAKSAWEKVKKREHYRMSSDGIPILTMADNTSPIKKLNPSLLSFFEQQSTSEPTIKAFVAAENKVPVAPIKKNESSTLSTSFHQLDKSFVAFEDKDDPATTKKLDASILSFFEQKQIKTFGNADVKPPPNIKKINSSLLSKFEDQRPAIKAFGADEEDVPEPPIKKLESSVMSTFHQLDKSFVDFASDDYPINIKMLDASILSFFEQQQPKTLVKGDVKPSAPAVKETNSSSLFKFNDKANDTFVTAEEDIPAAPIKNKIKSSIPSTFHQQDKSFVTFEDEDDPVTIKMLDASIISFFEQQQMAFVNADVKPTVKEINLSSLSKLDDDQVNATLVAVEEDVPAAPIKKIKSSLLSTFHQLDKPFVTFEDEDDPVTIKELDASIISFFEQQQKAFVNAYVTPVPSAVYEIKSSLLSKFDDVATETLVAVEEDVPVAPIKTIKSSLLSTFHQLDKPFVAFASDEDDPFTIKMLDKTLLSFFDDQATAPIEKEATVNNRKLDTFTCSSVPKKRPLLDFTDPLIPIKAPPLPGTPKVFKHVSSKVDCHREASKKDTAIKIKSLNSARIPPFSITPVAKKKTLQQTYSNPSIPVKAPPLPGKPKEFKHVSSRIDCHKVAAEKTTRSRL